MNDRELTALGELLEFAKLSELAAKAAGITLGLWSDDAQAFHVASNSPHWWNPIFNDGDALRLAVKLGIEIYPDLQVHEVHTAFMVGSYGYNTVEELGDDPLAATRRAIVRAAAEIGRAMP